MKSLISKVVCGRLLVLINIIEAYKHLILHLSISLHLGQNVLNFFFNHTKKISKTFSCSCICVVKELAEADDFLKWNTEVAWVSSEGHKIEEL